MKDFSLAAYKLLLITFQEKGYVFLTYEQYCADNNLPERFVILRHDVDRKASNALKMASLENTLGIKGSYYFRIVKKSNKPEIIKRIVKFGHEIGYHYEDLAIAKGDYQKAIKSFECNLRYFRKFYPIKTMCMHGSPLSKWDNRDLWKNYNYRDYGIIAEPYFDLNFNEIFYITDASRTWNNKKVTLRDKVKSNFNIKIDTAFDIISFLKTNKLPNKLMLNTHPQNWTNNKSEWYKILFWQNFKNTIKKIIIIYENTN